ncbi:MAG: SPFH domain-containing protein [Elusimicrobia bacterium]|nr:SPFH domain-containing protein [Elusimicrobiota bacterium]
MTKERAGNAASGWLMVPATVGVAAAGAYVLWLGIANTSLWTILGGLLTMSLAALICLGYFTLQPNEAAVVTLFGAYRGTVRTEGFCWTNPLTYRRHVSLRARNLNCEKLKVNDLSGNPIEIGAVVVWRVTDTAKAVFDIDDFVRYVPLQSETALRHLASIYSYDHADEKGISLRGNVEAVSETLKVELNQRLAKAGVEIDEARLTHLAYAPEIAHAMLRRQQAEAIIAAREKIVHGAVSMVEMALRQMTEKKIIQLDEERKAAMVGNLLVVLCGMDDAQPVINTGTLYT